ncbi:unnamed protein product [Protopolystoma xenopodis]|uniref:Uncharacterized protein n=1 Tax=Protopolystoma xenopodis TaxID=117903 RepID=A0A3S5CML6_9PLAT|nr:unnamed protein product [Protopolystoma xenopodis]
MLDINAKAGDISLADDVCRTKSSPESSSSSGSLSAPSSDHTSSTGSAVVSNAPSEIITSSSSIISSTIENLSPTTPAPPLHSMLTFARSPITASSTLPESRLTSPPISFLSPSPFAFENQVAQVGTRIDGVWSQSVNGLPSIWLCYPIYNSGPVSTCIIVASLIPFMPPPHQVQASTTLPLSSQQPRTSSQTSSELNASSLQQPLSFLDWLTQSTS